MPERKRSMRVERKKNVEDAGHQHSDRTCPAKRQTYRNCQNIGYFFKNVLGEEGSLLYQRVRTRATKLQ